MRRRQIYVATSDMVEQHVIFGQGALRVSARELLIEVEQNEKELQQRLAEDQARSTRNTIGGKLSPDILKQFERWRRG
ncbi:YacP-like NYN domain protein [compost metagenome]